MANPNKSKGDRAERALRDYTTDRYPDSFKTRAGFDDDLGDIVVEHAAGRVVLQVKDVAKPSWSKWFDQLRQQITTCRRASMPRRTVGGVIVHKQRGIADPASWRAVVPLSELFDLLDEVYKIGMTDAHTDNERGDHG